MHTCTCTRIRTCTYTCIRTCTRGSAIKRFFYTLPNGLMAGTTATVCYREVFTNQGFVSERFECTCKHIHVQAVIHVL